MAFIILFAFGALAVPLALDIIKHGKNNIIRRSGRDLLNFPRVQAALRSVHIATGRVSEVAVSIVSFSVLALVAYIAFRALAIVHYLVEVIAR